MSAVFKNSRHIDVTGHTQETELIEQLASARRSVQIQAIVKLARAGSSKQALEALVPLVNSDDREISFFAAQAAGKISQKIGIEFSSILSAPPSDTKDTIWKIERFLQPEKSKIPELLELIRQKSESIPEKILPAVAVFLAKHGNLDDSNFLEKQLLRDNSNLVIPFINAAEKIAPSVLYRVLPKLLASNAPLVRSMSIAALRRIDAEEAERHFSDILSSRDPENRLAAIGIAFLFPFDRVRDYILSMLPEEQDEEVLKACRSILASNPEMDCALRILDYLDTAETDQKARIAPIFKAVCQAMITAQLITPEQGHPDEILKVWKARRLNQFLDNLELQLTVADANKKKTILGWIENNRSHPKVQEFIQRLALNPQTEDSYKALINKASESSAMVQAQPASTIEPPDAPAAEDMQSKLKKLRSVEVDNFNEHKNWIIKEAESGNEVMKVEALKTLLKFFPHKKLIDLANDAFSSDSAAVRTQGLKILEKLDPDSLKDKISKLLTDKDEGFRVRVVRFALKHKQDQAIEEIKKLLKSPEQRFRANAVNFMALCPFTSVYDSLMEQLDLEDNVVIVRQILTILMNNPSKLVLKGLDSITKTSNPAIAMAVSQARNDLFDIIDSSGETASTELRKADDSGSKPYSVKNVRSIRGQKGWQPSYKAGKGGKNETDRPRWQPNWGLIIPGAIILIVLAMTPIMYLTTRDTDRPLPKEAPPSDFRAPERVKASHVDIPDEFRMNKPCALDVMVERVVSDTTIVVVYDSRQIMVNFENPPDKKVAEGGLINVTMVPYRVNPNGIIMAQGRDLITR